MLQIASGTLPDSNLGIKLPIPTAIPTVNNKPTKYTMPLISLLNTEEIVKKHTKINGHSRMNIYINVPALISILIVYIILIHYNYIFLRRLLD